MFSSKFSSKLLDRRLGRLAATAGAMILALIVAACDGAADEPAADEPAGAEPSEAAEEPTADETDPTEGIPDEELLDAAVAEGQVTWYTAIPTEASTAVAEAFMDEYPDIEAEVLRLPSFQLWERFRTEAAAGRNVADVISFSDWGVQKSAMAFDLVTPYVPPGIEENVPAEFIDPLEGYGWINRITTVGFVYNTDAVPDEYVPSDWTDLLDPWWGENDRLAIGDPAESAAIYAAFWSMAREDSIGPEFFQGLGELDPPLYAQGGQQLNAVTAGEHAGTIVVDYRGWQLIDDGAPVEIVYFPSGVGNSVDFNSVVTEAPNPNAARLFMNYLASSEGADVLARTLGAYLSRTDATAYPEGVGRPPIDEVPLLPLDLDAAADDYDAFNEQFDEWIGR